MSSGVPYYEGPGPVTSIPKDFVRRKGYLVHGEASKSHSTVISGNLHNVPVAQKTRFPMDVRSELSEFDQHVDELIALHTERGNLKEGLMDDKLAAIGHLATIGADLAVEDIKADPFQDERFIGALKTLHVVDEAIKRSIL